MFGRDEDTPEPTTADVENMVQRAVHALLREVSNLRTHVVEANGVATPDQVEAVHNAAMGVQEATGVGPPPPYDPDTIPQNEPTA